MKIKRCFFTLLACAVLTSGLGAYAGATVGEGETHTEIMVQRAMKRFSIDVDSDTLAKMSSDFPLAAGDTITIQASYSPSSASVDFGYLDPDGLFHFVTVTGGSVNYTFEVDERGSYTLAIRNNSSWTVSVSGYVNY